MQALQSSTARSTLGLIDLLYFKPTTLVNQYDPALLTEALIGVRRSSVGRASDSRSKGPRMETRTGH